MLSYEDLVANFKKSKFAKCKGEILQFSGIDDLDAYNPTLIQENGKTYLAARVESRQSDWNDPAHYDPKVMFFENVNSQWRIIADAPIFDLAEDPFCTWIKDGNKQKLLFGFVRVKRPNGKSIISTRFLLADSIFNLREESCFFVVDGMRDIRLLQQPGGGITVCTRPFINGLGRICLNTINSIADFNQKTIDTATLLASNVKDNIYLLGNNQLHFLRRGIVGTLGHAAHEDEKGNYIYSSAAWTINLDSRKMSEPKLIARRPNFPKGQAKNSRLGDVVFSGSLEELPNGEMKLYAGLNDVNCGSIVIPNPFV